MSPPLDENMPDLEELKNTAQKAAEQLLKTPGMRSISIVFDWEIESSELPTGTYNAKTSSPEAAIGMCQQLPKFAQQIVSLWGDSLFQVLQQAHTMKTSKEKTDE